MDSPTFRWDPLTDHAVLVARGGAEPVWTGSLLPVFLLSDVHGRRTAVKAAVVSDTGGVLALDLPPVGTGTLSYTAGDGILRFTRLTVGWIGEPPRVVSLSWGCSPLTARERQTAPQDEGMWPDWRCGWFTLPGAKGGPIQSTFRRWDLGHADIPLGSFGPAMGTPYGAAYPRPVFAAAMGDDRAMLCAGSGSLPDGALTLRIRASSACLELLYREDLWGGPGESRRTWEAPLTLTWDRDAWHAFRRQYRSFPPRPVTSPRHQRSFMGTWGDFRRGVFDLKITADRAVDEVGGQVLCVDDPWESFKGSGVEHLGRLATIEEDLEYARHRGLGVGIWQAAGWIEDPTAAGLSTEDLLLTGDGRPARANWGMDPRDPAGWYCLDPGSPSARDYLRRRTDRIMRRLRPALLKLDFSYGLPSPDIASPRDPVYRGERMALTLLETIATAARAVDPDVTILGYSLHPLWDPVQDQVALDDLGDAGTEEAAGHGQWSAWASLAGDRGLAVMASSGYDWDADAEVLLNTAVIGAPGMNLPRVRPDGTPPTPAERGRRKALARWFRRTTRWEPLWLDTPWLPSRGQPCVRSWGRLEPGADGPRLAALCLRRPTPEADREPRLRGLRWSGRWAVIAQDDRGIFDSALVAVVPFDAGALALPCRSSPAAVRAVLPSGEQPWPAWTWADGLLTLTVDEAVCHTDLLGVLIRG